LKIPKGYPSIPKGYQRIPKGYQRIPKEYSEDTKGVSEDTEGMMVCRYQRGIREYRRDDDLKIPKGYQRIPKEYSEDTKRMMIRRYQRVGRIRANRRRSNNTMVKRNRTKGQTLMHKTFYRNLKIEEDEPH
jgi:hypothetical protein